MATTTTTTEVRARLSISHLDPTTLVWGLAAILLLILIIVPMFYLLRESLFVPDDIEAFHPTGTYGIANFIETYTNELYRGPIIWTLIIAVSVGCFSLVIGSVMAWAVARTDVPFPGFIRTAALVSFVTPPFWGRPPGCCWRDPGRAGSTCGTAGSPAGEKRRTCSTSSP